MKHYDNAEPVVDMEEQTQNKNRIVETLESFGIKITSIKATVGPTVTLYEITPQQGVRISRIKGLEDDIALSLSALGIRIIAPIPGKGTIGIEVPNSSPKIVSGQSILGSKKFQDSAYDLPVALGKNHHERGVHVRPLQDASYSGGRCHGTGQVRGPERHHCLFALQKASLGAEVRHGRPQEGGVQHLLRHRAGISLPNCPTRPNPSLPM